MTTLLLWYSSTARRHFESQMVKNLRCQECGYEEAMPYNAPDDVAALRRRYAAWWIWGAVFFDPRNKVYSQTHMVVIRFNVGPSLVLHD
jgi:hypothetical protein